MNGESKLSAEGPFEWSEALPVRATPADLPELEGPFELSPLREASRESEASAEAVFSAAEVCPQEPIPAGWHGWGAGRAPPELEAIAVRLKNHIDDFPYGEVIQTIDYKGKTVGFFKSHHTWTYRGGKLVKGICIPGISLLVAGKLRSPSTSTSTKRCQPSATRTSRASRARRGAKRRKCRRRSSTPRARAPPAAASNPRPRVRWRRRQRPRPNECSAGQRSPCPGWPGPPLPSSSKAIVEPSARRSLCRCWSRSARTSQWAGRTRPGSQKN